MHIPPEFEEVRESEILKIIENFPLATIICHNDGDLMAHHIPLLRISQSLYIGHINKANSLHTIFPHGVDAMAIFSAENSYISPNWYPTKARTHRHAPTWNYQTVHMKGRIAFDSSQKAKLSAVGKLTKKYEKIYSGKREWRMSDAPRDYIEHMLDNIVALEFDVQNIIAMSKISQNREMEDYNSVKQMMKEHNKKYLFEAMDNIEKLD